MSEVDDLVRRRVARALERSGLSVNALSKKAGVNESTVRAWLKNPRQSASIELIGKIARGFGMNTADLLRAATMVPVVGYVGAGAVVYAVDDHEQGAGLGEVEAPPGHTGRGVAVVVRGDSMYPAYEDGDILHYARELDFIEAACLGNTCVVKVVDGPTYVKRVMRGSQKGRYTLLSYNGPPMEDVRIEWAAPVQFVDKRKVFR